MLMSLTTSCPAPDFSMRHGFAATAPARCASLLRRAVQRHARHWRALPALFLTTTLALSGCSSQATQPSGTPQYVNAHMHASYLGDSDADYRADVLTDMRSNNIAVSVLHLNEASDIDDWVRAAPGKFLAGPSFPCFQSDASGRRSCVWDNGDWPSIEWLRTGYLNGDLAIMGELMLVYAGIAPTDARMDPYWALAAELDIPVAIHINRGPPKQSVSRPDGCCADFDADIGNPALLRPVLARHPGLRLILQHAGFPAIPDLGGIDYLDETFALLADFPKVYVDMTALNSFPPAFVHTEAVRQFKARGFLDRLMMGTDNWPTEAIIARYNGFDFLTPAQKADILGGNARRFFRLP